VFARSFISARRQNEGSQEAALRTFRDGRDRPFDGPSERLGSPIGCRSHEIQRIAVPGGGRFVGDRPFSSRFGDFAR
jgi:hypothetical protein